MAIIGIINAFPMSLVQDLVTLDPNVPHHVLKEILHPDDWARGDHEIAWLWGHKNSSEMAAHFLHEEFGVIERWEGFGERPTVTVEDGEFYAKRIDGELIHIDKLIVLAPTLAFNERKAEGAVAVATEIVGFRPIVVGVR